MKKIKKKIYLILVLLIVNLVFWKVFFFDEWSGLRKSVNSEKSVSIYLSMDINAEYPFNLQLFWTENEFEYFEEKQSVIQAISRGASHIEQLIPANIVYSLRLDFGNNPGKVVIKNIKLRGINSTTLDVNKFELFSHDITTHEIVDDALVITSGGKDPYTVYGSALNIVTD